MPKTIILIPMTIRVENEKRCSLGCYGMIRQLAKKCYFCSYFNQPIIYQERLKECKEALEI